MVTKTDNKEKGDIEIMKEIVNENIKDISLVAFAELNDGKEEKEENFGRYNCRKSIKSINTFIKFN